MGLRFQQPADDGKCVQALGFEVFQQRCPGA